MVTLTNKIVRGITILSKITLLIQENGKTI